MNPLEIAKNMRITHNVTFRVIDRGTNKVVKEYAGHNMATNSMVLGVGYFLAGGGDLDPNAIYKNFIPKYISLGTMGLINQDEDADGLPIGIGSADSTIPDDESAAHKAERYTAYMDEVPGYGADGYGDNPIIYNNGRPDYGLGPVYSSGEPIKCELISTSFPRTKIAYSNVINEENAETPQTVDVVVSAMISTGALAQFRNGADHIFITEAGLWSTDKYSSSGRGLLAGYRIKPPNDANWDMTDPENQKILQENIIRVGINQVVQVVWKIQIGSVARLNLSEGYSEMMKKYIQGDSVDLLIPTDTTSIAPNVFYLSSLTGVTIPNTVQTIGNRAFYGSESLSKVNMQSGVTYIGVSSFEHCVSLGSIAIPSTVTVIDNYAFSDCTSLSTVTLTDGITTIGKYAFSDCTSLRVIHIPSTVTFIWYDDTVEPNVGAFTGCTNLERIIVHKGSGSLPGYTTKWGAPNSTSIIWAP